MDYSLLRDRIASSGYTLGELADLCDLSRNTLSNLVNGRMEPTLYTCQVISFVLDLSDREFLDIFVRGTNLLFEQKGIYRIGQSKGVK